LLPLLLDPEDGSDYFLRNIGLQPPVYCWFLAGFNPDDGGDNFDS
jgi:hypothetical protein